MRKKHHTLLHSISGVLRTPAASITLDVLVILSLLLNVYSFVESAKLGGELNMINAQLTLLNKTLEKTTLDNDPTPQPTKLSTTADAQCPITKQT